MRRHSVLLGLSAVAVVALAFADGSPGGVFVSGPDLLTGRMAHKIVTLPDGDVLVVGGRGPGFDSLTTAELWHPQTNAWVQFDAAAEELDDCAMVRLADGRYLVAGGAYDGGGTPGHNSASIFDPATTSFTPTSAMTYRRFQCSGALLTNGEVLIAGGWWGGGGSALYGEIYDTATMSFSHTTGAMTIERSAPLVVPCDDGTAFVLGGYPPYGGAGYERVDSYDPATNQFSIASEQVLPGDAGWIVYPSSNAPRPIDEQRTPDGKYLLLAYRAVAGNYEQALFTVDPATKQFAPFTTTPALPMQNTFVLAEHPAIDRARGRAYLVGAVGGTAADVAVYAVDLVTHELVVPTGSFHVEAASYPIFAGTAVLADGRLLLTGGRGEASNATPTAMTFLITPGGVEPPGPVPVRQFLLPTKITRKLNARNPAKDVLTLSAALDTGPDPAAFAATATFTIGGIAVPVTSLTPDRKGVWRSASALFALAIVPGASGSSRCTVTATLKGAQVLAVDADAAVGLALSCGNVSAESGCTLTKGGFTLGHGALPTSLSVPRSASATLAGPGKDSFTVKWVMAPSSTPSQMSDIVFQFGPNYSKTIPGASFRKKGSVFSFTDKTNALPSMTINTATGFITVTAKKADLGTFPQGAQPVRLAGGPLADLSIVEVRMVRTGRTLKY